MGRWPKKDDSERMSKRIFQGRVGGGRAKERPRKVAGQYWGKPKNGWRRVAGERREWEHIERETRADDDDDKPRSKGLCMFV